MQTVAASCSQQMQSAWGASVMVMSCWLMASPVLLDGHVKCPVLKILRRQGLGWLMIGFLITSPVIGLIADHAGLRWAMVVPLVAAGCHRHRPPDGAHPCLEPTARPHHKESGWPALTMPFLKAADLEGAREFFVTYFGATANEEYHNPVPA